MRKPHPFKAKEPCGGDAWTIFRLGLKWLKLEGDTFYGTIFLDLKAAKRMRDWMDRAIAWMEEKDKM